MTNRVAVTTGFALSLIALAGVVAPIDGRQAAASNAHAIMTPDQVKYAPIEVPGFATGLKIAVIHGDPNAESGMYVIRLQFPARYRFPAHWHPNAENLTVLSGEFLLGMGEREDSSKIVSYKPGTFMYIPGKMPHFGGVQSATVIQLHGQAPFKIELVKAAKTN
jgi:mannose-6-phosphate isomerase-like protein (cupin superfamily)